MKKRLSILGSTGTIGLNSLKIFDKKKNFFQINLLAADKNYKLICKQIHQYKPRFFIINNFNIYKKIKKKFKKNNIKIFNNINFKKNILKKSDITITAIPGIAGLNPTIEMIKKSKKVLLANKESIICGWHIIKKTAAKNKTKLVPVDSEHFSIMKLLENHPLKEVKKIYLTASGGPFLNYSVSQLKYVKPSIAIKHPKWVMGKKISIDSATLMNKMLEVIEAQKLFSLNLNKINIIIHPESLVHAIIELKNGLHKLIYHNTTMIIPLGIAMLESNFRIDEFVKIKTKNDKQPFFKKLNFLNVNEKKFQVIKLKDRLNEHFSTPIIVNAVNEILVDQFLNKKIPFNSFFRYLSMVMNDDNYKKYAIRITKNIKQIYQIDEWARTTTFKKIKKNA